MQRRAILTLLQIMLDLKKKMELFISNILIKREKSINSFRIYKIWQKNFYKISHFNEYVKDKLGISHLTSLTEKILLI